MSDLTRHLRFAGADDKVLAAAKGMRCQTCERTKKVAAPRPATFPSFLDFNTLVSDVHTKRHELLSITDHATTYHLVAVLEGHSTEAFEKGFVDLWARGFGAPRDLGSFLLTLSRDFRMHLPGLQASPEPNFAARPDKPTGNKV